MELYVWVLIFVMNYAGDPMAVYADEKMCEMKRTELWRENSFSTICKRVVYVPGPEI